MFDTIEEAEEINSECAFCKKPKFVVRDGENGKFDLGRCEVDNCDRHCFGGHALTVEYQLGDRDSVGIASGWT